MLSAFERVQFSRQISLPEIGPEGQELLKHARVLCVGVGGLGSPVALYLAAAGVGHIGLVDGDTVDASNLPRQILFRTKDIKQKKTTIAADRLTEINPNISVESIAEQFDLISAMDLLSRYDVVVDGTDNFTAKFLINDAAVKAGVPVVYGAIYQFEGQASVFWAKWGPCYRCYLPEPPRHSVQNCAEAGVLGPVAGVIGSIQAIEAIKMTLTLSQNATNQKHMSILSSALLGKLLIFDGLNMQFLTIQISKNPKCRVCSLPPDQIHLREEKAGGCRTEAPENDCTEISTHELLQNDFYKTCVLIDVREPHEWHTSRLPNAANWPLSKLENSKAPCLDPTKHYVLYCQSGFRSKRALQLLSSPTIQLQHLRYGMSDWGGPVISSIHS